MNPRISFSLVFLATAALFHAGEVNGDVCSKTAYESLCQYVVKGITDPKKALEASINYAILRTNHASIKSRAMGTDDKFNICREMYDDAVSDLTEAIQYLYQNDKGGLNTNLSSAISYYTTCDDAFGESGAANPLADINEVLVKLVDNSLSLVTKLKK